MHEVDLSKYDLHTDLIIEEKIDGIKKNSYKENDIQVDDIILDKDNKIKRKSGKYITITYSDITDFTNYQNVLKIVIRELKKLLKYCNINKNASCMIVGLGNRKIISDSLGSKTIDEIIVTRHMYLLNDVDKRYRNVSILEPNVIGVTGIDSFEVIFNVVKKIKPDFIICIDSLCAMNIDRLNKTIQITSSGITPGSGVGNYKEELSSDTLGIPTIAIGIPSVVNTSVIVSDTINYLLKKIGYLKNNLNNSKDKLKPVNKVNYLESMNDLSDYEKKELLGYIGLLDNESLKTLIWEVLSPIDADMIVTTKEIDFIMEKNAKLLGEALNNALHNIEEK